MLFFNLNCQKKLPFAQELLLKKDITLGSVILGCSFKNLNYSKHNPYLRDFDTLHTSSSHKIHEIYIICEIVDYSCMKYKMVTLHF